jgi:L-rhamnose mutarotase
VRLPTNEAEVLYVHVCASLATPSLNREEYVAQNRQNLDEFIAALTAASVPGLSYRVFLDEDGQTFLHLVTSQDDPSAVITGLPSFKKFQSELLASDLS